MHFESAAALRFAKGLVDRLLWESTSFEWALRWAKTGYLGCVAPVSALQPMLNPGGLFPCANICISENTLFCLEYYFVLASCYHDTRLKRLASIKMHR